MVIVIMIKPLFIKLTNINNCIIFINIHDIIFIIDEKEHTRVRLRDGNSSNVIESISKIEQMLHNIIITL